MECTDILTNSLPMKESGKKERNMVSKNNVTLTLRRLGYFGSWKNWGGGGAL